MRAWKRRPTAREMSEATALIDFLDAVAMRSGGVVLALCALSLVVALSRGWLYGRRYVELLKSQIAELQAERKTAGK